MSVVGVVPAAGTASRLQPFAGSKEAALVGGRPVIRYLLDRMVIGGAVRIRVVVRPAKTDLVDLVAHLGHEIVPAQPRSVSASVLAGLDGLDPDDIVLLGFPDSVWQPADGFLAVGAEVERGADLALGLFRVEEPERSDVVQLSAAGLVEGIDVKPRQPRSDWIWGCLAGRVRVLGQLDPADELSDFVAREARRAAVPGVRLGRLIDVGTRRALAEADAHPVVRASARSGRIGGRGADDIDRLTGRRTARRRSR